MQPVATPGIESKAATTSRIAAFDLIRVFATFSVIVVHVATPVVQNNLPDSDVWLSGHLYQSVFRSGIPLFLMLTGALLLPRATGISFSVKRFLRVFFPFTFWTFVSLVGYNRISDLKMSDFIHGLVHGVSGYYWYVYLIVPIYFILPLIRKSIINANLTAEKGVIITVLTIALWYITYLLIPEAANIIQHLIYLEFVIVGYLLSIASNRSWLGKKAVSYTLIVAGVACTYFSTYFQVSAENTYSEFFYESVNLAIFLKAVGFWFLFGKAAEKLPAKVGKSISYISRFTFAIFLMHPLVIDFILVSRLGFNLHFEEPGTGIIVVSLLCIVFATAIAVILSKLPFGKYTY